ncbi:HET-domain-containing protein, partial [Cryphonectria parasitica EP155]
MQAKFVHKALEFPSSEIRLLELLPGTGREKIQCRLSTSPLCDLPSYQPLSYCWGSQINLVEIFVAGESFLVTRNLAAALRRLRRPKDSCILWVDAICINQYNKLEKSFQIPLMAEIYRRGERTIVWLGEHDRRTARAFTMLEVMARYVDTVSKDKLVRLHPDKWHLVRSGHARTSVFGRAWFKRVWIIQEIAM